MRVAVWCLIATREGRIRLSAQCTGLYDAGNNEEKDICIAEKNTSVEHLAYANASWTVIGSALIDM